MTNNLQFARKTPPGILLIRKIRGKDWSLKTYRYMILLLTFIAYTSYHASRKPSSIVKRVLDPEPEKKSKHHPWPVGEFFVKNEFSSFHKIRPSYPGWEPFNGKGGTSKLGEIDVAFLACYSFGMYVAGHLGDRLDLRLFLTFGMVFSGMFVGLFGMGYFWNIHVFFYFLLMQMLAGLFQATGWPSVVAVIGNWFGKRKRGLIMGVWNAHTSVGNISGSLLAAAVLDYGWGWSFIAPGLFIVAAGLLVFLFLAPYPEDIEFCSGSSVGGDEESQRLVSGVVEGEGDDSVYRLGSDVRKGVGLLEACFIPGVIPFALCLFFSKLVAYTFLYWLPFYLSQTEIGGEYLSVKSAGNLSTMFDIGGIVGGIIAGYISDKLKARAITASTFLFFSIPAMLLYYIYGSLSRSINIALMMIVGLFVNGPYALITTAVSADLGTHKSLKGDSRALATVTAIIDGTGSIGAALGPLFTGFLSSKGWGTVFAMLMIGALMATILLCRQVVGEITEKIHKPLSSSPRHQSTGGTTSEPLISNQR